MMTEFYNFIGIGIIETKNQNCCKYCKYRQGKIKKDRKIWCDYVDIIPIGPIIPHKNCNHFKWNLF